MACRINSRNLANQRFTMRTQQQAKGSCNYNNDKKINKNKQSFADVSITDLIRLRMLWIYIIQNFHNFSPLSTWDWKHKFTKAWGSRWDVVYKILVGQSTGSAFFQSDQIIRGKIKQAQFAKWHEGPLCSEVQNVQCMFSQIFFVCQTRKISREKHQHEH